MEMGLDLKRKKQDYVHSATGRQDTVNGRAYDHMTGQARNVSKTRHSNKRNCTL